MAEVVVAGPALLVALTPVVVLVTPDPESVLDVGRSAGVPDGLPVVAGIHHASVCVAFNQILLTS